MTMEQRDQNLPIFKWKRIGGINGTPPRPRHGHRAISIQHYMLVFGGGNEGIFDGIHFYDTVLKQWVEPNMTGDISPGRAAFGWVLDNTRLICFGGMLEFGHYSNDIYELQLKAWAWKVLVPLHYHHQPTPCPRLGHSFNLVDNKVYLFGGLARSSSGIHPRYLNDLFVLHLWENGTVEWEMPKVNGVSPPPRESHSTVSYRDRYGHDKLIIYGGMNGNRLGDLWTLHLSTLQWSKEVVCGKVPLPRSLHSATVMAHRMFVFGGWVPLISDDKSHDNFYVNEREWKCSNQLACLNLETMIWEDLQIDVAEEKLPKARAGHTAVAVGSRIYIWSGRDGYKKAWNNQMCCKDFWFLETETPPATSRIQLISSSTNTLEVNWLDIPYVDEYILQIMKYTYQQPQRFDKYSEMPPFSSVQFPQSNLVNPSTCSPVSIALSANKSKPPLTKFPMANIVPPVPTPAQPNVSIRSPPPTYPLSPPPISALPANNLAPQGPPSVSSLSNNESSPHYIPYSVDNSQSSASSTPSVASTAPTTTTSNPIVITIPPGPPKLQTVPQPAVAPAIKTAIPRPVRSTVALTKTVSSHIPVACAPVAPLQGATPNRSTLLPILSTKLQAYSIPGNNLQNVRGRNQPLTLWPIRTIASGVGEPAASATSEMNNQSAATTVNQQDPSTTVTTQLASAINQSPAVKARPVTIITPSNFAKTLSAGKPLRFNVQKVPGAQGKNCVFLQKGPGVIAKENIPKITLGQPKTLYKIVNSQEYGPFVSVPGMKRPTIVLTKPSSTVAPAIPPGTRVITIKRPASAIKVPDNLQTVALESNQVPQPTSIVTELDSRLPIPSAADGTRPSTSNAVPESSPELQPPQSEELNPISQIDEGSTSQTNITLKRPLDTGNEPEESPILGKLLKLS